MKNGAAMKIFLTVAVVVLVALVMTLLSVVPPLSYLYDWAERNNMKFVWGGVIAGVIALCLLLLYHYYLKK